MRHMLSEKQAAQNPGYLRLITERTVEKFMLRLFLRETRIRTIAIVSPFIAPMSGCRFSLSDLRNKVESERIPTYIITRAPEEDYQRDAMEVLSGCPVVEIRYNNSIHAKLYVATAEREADSFALFGSGNLTAKSIESNIELAAMVYGKGSGRKIIQDLHYWAHVRLRTVRESHNVQKLQIIRR